MTRTRFIVVFEGEAGADTAHAHTLRYLLKYLLRSRSLRCVDVRHLELEHRADAAETTPSTGGAK
jgi:hypothetical protein